MASTKQDGDKRTLTDMVYIVTICHACMPVCRQCPIYTLYFKRTYLYDIKYLSVRPHKNKIVTTALRKLYENSTRKKDQFETKPLKLRRKGKKKRPWLRAAEKLKKALWTVIGLRFAMEMFASLESTDSEIKEAFKHKQSTYKEASPNKRAHLQPPCDLGKKGQASPLEQTRFMPEGTQGSSRPVLKCQTCCFGWMEWCNCCWVCKERRRKQVIKEMN